MSTDLKHKVDTDDQSFIEDPKLAAQIEAANAVDIPDRARKEKKLLWKLDARFSILIVVYILNYIDRNNLSAAKTQGLEADLGLVGSQYPTLLSILYVGYILMQVPSNALVQYTGRPSIYLPVCMTIWGLISLLSGVTKNFVGMLMTRFFLGFVEAAFFPGAIFLLSKWYTRKELGLRTAILYCGSLISNAFGPLIASGILSKMEGVRGFRAWEWLFFIEGALTMFIALLCIPILPDFPHNSRGFSAEEKMLAQLRMREDAGEADDDTTTFLQALKMMIVDPKTWVMSLSLTAMVIGLCFNQFFPQITATLGYSHTVSLLLCAPPFAWATIVAFAVARHSDATQERFWHIVGPLCGGIVGFIMALASPSHMFAPRYVSLFLMASSYAGFVVFYGWISGSFPRPPMKRACAIAFVNAFSQLGNISGAYTYPAGWGPSYQKSFGIGLAMFMLTFVGLFTHRTMLARENKAIEEAENENRSTYPPGFRYLL